MTTAAHEDISPVDKQFGDAGELRAQPPAHLAPKAVDPWRSSISSDTLAWARAARAKGLLVEAERLYRLIFEDAPADSALAQPGFGLDEATRADAIAAARAELGAALLAQARLSDAAAVLTPLAEDDDARVAGAALAHLAQARRALGEAREAIAIARRAVAADASCYETHLALARTLLDLRQRKESVTSFRRALSINPSRPDAFGGLARALIAMNDLHAGETAIAEARARSPDDPDALRAVSDVLAKRGDRPGAAAASNAAARTLFARGYHREAQDAFETAAKLAPDVAGYHNDAGTSAYLRRRPGDALPWLERAVSLQPAFAQALSNLGAALMETGHFARSEQRLREALAVDPRHAEAHVNLANLLLELRRGEEAEQHYRLALEIQPQLAAARLGLGIMLLAQERFEEAFNFYESRPAGVRAASLGLALWRGEDDREAQTVIVMSEQGLGDTLQFLSAVRAAPTRFKRVGFVCAPVLQRLSAHNLPGVEILPALPADLGAADRYVNLLSLAALLAPGNALTHRAHAFKPWIAALPDDIETWRNRLDSAFSGRDTMARAPRVGLCWGGGDALRDDWLRSIPLSALAPLLQIRDIQWVSLQIGTKRAQLAKIAAASRPLDPADEIADFADTAALVHNLDLVISVDTAVAHLAGAMGKPIWLLNRHASEWRWGIARDACAYYPTMRIFNQPAPLDWTPVVADVSRALATMDWRAARAVESHPPSGWDRNDAPAQE